MSGQIVQKLITFLTWQVDDRGQKQYDQTNQRLNAKMVGDNKKANDKRIAQEQKTAEQQKKIAEKVYEFELKVRERLARQEEKIAQQKQKRIDSEFEKDYKKLLQHEQKQEQVREKALQFEQRLRAKLSQIKDQEAQRDLIRSQKLANQQNSIEEQNLRRRLQARERDFNRRLQDIQNRNNAREQAQRDRISQGYALQGSGRSIKGAGSAGMALFGGLIGESVTTAGDIEKLLNQVQAHGGFKSGDRGMLSKLAKSVSVSSGFAQTELLLAMKELGKAGYKGNDLVSLTSQMPNFALATDSTLQQSSKLTTDMLELFGYKIQDATKVMDTLTTGLSESKLDFTDMSTALKYSAPAWKASGGKLEDLIAVLAIQSQSGIKGSTAGTGTRAATVNLALSSIASDMSGIKSNKQLKQRQKSTVANLGLKNVYDKNDNLDYFSTMRQLGIITKGMKTNKKQSILYDLFGKTAMNQNYLVMDAMSDPKKAKRNEDLIAKTRGSFGNNNTANMSGIMKQGYNFQKGQFENSIVNVQEAIGKNFLPTFTELFNKMASFFNMISEKYPFLISLATAFLVVGLAVSVLAVAFGSLLIVIGSVAVIMSILEIGLGALFAWFLIIPIAIATLGYIFYQFATGGKNAFNDFIMSITNLGNQAFGIDLPNMFSWLISAFSSPLETMKSLWLGFVEQIAGFFPKIAGWVSGLSANLQLNAGLGINPTLPTAGKQINVFNNQQFNTTAHGTNANPNKLANTISNGLLASNKKSWSQMAQVYK